MFKKILIYLSLIMFSACSINIKDYKNNVPKLDIKEYLNGELKAYGILENMFGKVTRKFEVNMYGKIENNQLILEEDFIFNDGEKSKRIWKVNFTDKHNFTAKADDVINYAKGMQYGDTAYMNYILELKVGDKLHKVKLDDYLYLVNDRILINKSKIKKFGLTVGKLTIIFEKVK